MVTILSLIGTARRSGPMKGDVATTAAPVAPRSEFD
jgi:hypothetical protein